MFQRLFSRLVAPAGILVAAAALAQSPVPPVARVEPHPLTAHGDTRVDDYYWLRERENPEVLAYLKAENAYTEAMLAPSAALRDTLLAEMKGRLKPDDATVPYRLDGWWYQQRFVPGGEYPVWSRRQGGAAGPEGSEQVMFDGNALAKGGGYFSLRVADISPDARLALYAVDTVGRRFYTLRVRDLDGSRELDDIVPDVTGEAAWALDNRTFLYTRQDPGTLRSYQVWRHVLGTPATADVLVYQEDDETFECSVSRSKSDRWLFIESSQTLGSEWRVLPADDPAGAFRVFQPRERGLEYSIEHQGDRFLVRTNLGALNFRLMECPLDRTGREDWRDVIAPRDDVLLEGFDVFARWLVVTERYDGLSHLRVIPLDGGPGHTLAFPDPTWAVSGEANPELDTDVLRYQYSSLTTPPSTYAFDLRTHAQALLKRQEIRGGFDPADYEAEYLRIPARDGTLVPVSLVHRKGLARDGSAPLLLYGYGSYGYSQNARFNAPMLSLVDRGFVYAIAHVRGGQELGRGWYDAGRMLRKRNTFDDFIAVAEELIRRGYTRPERLTAQGASAGGLLMGVVANERPDLFRALVADVPFVDVINTLLDPSLPLTAQEWEQWGNPARAPEYHYLRSYSPYDNVRPQAYPWLLVTAALHDSQVMFWEPAKWVARLRATATGAAPLLLQTHLEGGHVGPTDRYARLREAAFRFAFLLDAVGLAATPAA